MKKYLSLEFFKMKRLGIGLTTFALLAVELLWLTFAAKRSSAALNCSNAAAPVWEYLFMTQMMLQGLFFPVIISVTVSRANDMEHKGSTWKLLESSAQTKAAIWQAKFISSYLIIVFVQVIGFLYLLIFGRSLGIAEPLPASEIAKCFFGTLAVDAALLLLQQWLSILIENQLVAIATGILGAFIGLFSNFMPKLFRILLIWGYYTNLSPATMSATAVAENVIPIETVPVSLVPILIALALAVALYFAGKRRFSKGEA